MIGHKRVPSREGGIEIAVEELAIRLTAMGHQVDCYNRWQDFGAGAVRLPREYKGIRLIRIPTLATPSLNAFIYSVLAVLRALAGGYDVMHFHAEGPCAMTFLPRLFGIPVVSTIHGLDWQRAKWGRFASRYLLWGERNAARYSDALIVLSNGNQQYFTQTYGRETIYIPNGVSLIPCREPEEIGRRWNLSKNSYILFLSRLVPEKGLHYLIGAYKKMDTDKRLVIAGGLTRNNEYVEQIRGMAEDDPRILFTDFVQGRVLEELMSNCCVYVLPSDIEGMSISLLEAMSCGLPVCATAVGGIPRLVEEKVNGFLSQAGDAEALARNCLRVLDDPQAGDALGRAGRGRVERDFSFTAMVEAHQALFERLWREAGREQASAGRSGEQTA